MTFYRNGKTTGKAMAPCLEGAQMKVFFTHDVSPEFGGKHDPKNWCVLLTRRRHVRRACVPTPVGSAVASCAPGVCTNPCRFRRCVNCLCKSSC